MIGELNISRAQRLICKRLLSDFFSAPQALLDGENLDSSEDMSDSDSDDMMSSSGDEEGDGEEAGEPMSDGEGECRIFLVMAMSFRYITLLCFVGMPSYEDTVVSCKGARKQNCNGP